MPAPALTPDAVLKRHPGAAHLSVFDGRHCVGLVLDTRSPAPRSPQAPSFAFDRDGVGQFTCRRDTCRRDAVRALPGGRS